MTHRRPLVPALALAALALLPRPAHAASDYIALGDSYAYGFTTTQALVTTLQGFLTTQDPADTASLLGLQGYVAPFALSQGISLSRVTNLALTGETLGSFLGGGNTSTAINLNYTQNPAASQSTHLGSTLAAIKSQGDSVKDITVQLGGNDILGLASQLGLQPPAPGQAPQFSAAQQQIIGGGLATFNTSYTALLRSLKASSASVFAIGYFDPFTPLGDAGQYATSDPFFGYGSLLLPDLNAAIRSDAAQAGVQFVDIDTTATFAGHEIALSEDTQPLDQSLLKALDPAFVPSLPDSFPDYHPNAAGYQVIAGQLAVTAAAVPEPGAWALLAAGLPLIGLTARRRRAWCLPPRMGAAGGDR